MWSKSPLAGPPGPAVRYSSHEPLAHPTIAQAFNALSALETVVVKFFAVFRTLWLFFNRLRGDGDMTIDIGAIDTRFWFGFAGK